MTPSPPEASSPRTSPRTRQHRRLAHRMRQTQDRIRMRLAALLAEFFARQAHRVVSRLTRVKLAADDWDWERKADANELLPDEERRFLQALILPLLEEAFNASADLAGDMVGLAEPLSSEDPRTLRFLADAGTQITNIHQATVAAVRDVLQEGHLAGYSNYHIAHGVPADGYRGIAAVVTETYHGRADTIARTEVGRASALGAVARYQEASVSEVDVEDGDGCGWDGHDDSDEANGSRRTLIDAEAMPLSHPNCVRVFLPVLPGE